VGGDLPTVEWGRLSTLGGRKYSLPSARLFSPGERIF